MARLKLHTVLFNFIILLAIFSSFVEPLKWFESLHRHSNASYNGTPENMKDILDQRALQEQQRLLKIHKRDSARVQLHRDQGQLLILKGLEYSKGCPGVLLDFQIFSYMENYFAVLVTKAQENNTLIYSFSLEDGCQEYLTMLPSKAAIETTIVKTGKDEINIIIIENQPTSEMHNHTGSPVYLVTFEDGSMFTGRKELLKSEHPSCITSWVQYGTPHVAICNSRTINATGGDEKFLTKSYIYAASGGFFDKILEIETYNPQRITHFEVFNRHYLAIASYPSPGGFNVPSEVLRHDLTTGSYKHLQYLPTKAALDICFFTLGSGIETEHYLVTVNHVAIEPNGEFNYDVKSHIYKFDGEMFAAFQSIPTREATSCLTYKSANGEFFLVFAESSGASIYQYNGWNFVPTTQYTQHAMGIGVWRLRSALISGTRYIAVSNTNPELAEGNNLFLPRFESHHTLSDVYVEAQTWCKQAKEEVTSYPVATFVDVYQQSVKKNDTVVPLGSVTIGDLEAEIVTTNEYEVKSKDLRVDVNLTLEIQMLSAEILDLFERLQQLDDKYQNAIRTEGEYYINGPAVVGSLSSSCTSGCRVEDLTAARIGTIQMDDLLSNAILLSDEEIDSPLTVQYLQVESDVDTETLNEKPVATYQTIYGEFELSELLTVEGDVRFRRDVVVGSVNSVEVSPENLLLKQGNQNLSWTLKADELLADNILASIINEHDIDDYLENALKTTDSILLVDPVFPVGFGAEKFEIRGLANDVDFSGLLANAMRLDDNQNITGIHTYAAVSTGKATVGGTVNGLAFPDQLVRVNSEEEEIIEASVAVTNDALFSSIFVTNQLGSVEVVNGNFDCLMQQSDSPQVVTGKKVFNNVLVGREATAKSINDVPFEYFQTQELIHGKPDDTLYYDNSDIHGTVKVDHLVVGELPGVDLERLRHKALPLDAETFPPLSSLTFQDLHVESDLSAKRINGQPADAFLRRDAGNSTPTEARMLDGDDTDLQSGALQKQDEELILEGEVIIGQIEAKRIIVGGKDFEFMRIGQTEVLGGAKIVPGLVIEGDWSVGDLAVDGLLDGVDLGIWQRDTLRKRGDQTIRGKKHFSSVSIHGNVVVNDMDGCDVDALRDVVLTSQTVVVDVDVVVKGPVRVDELEVEGAIDGVDSRAPLHWLLYDEDQDVPLGIGAEKSISVSQLDDLSWTIGPVNVSRLLRKAYTIDAPFEMDQLNIDSLEADNINVGGRIQGVRVPQDFVDPESEDPIGGIKNITEPVSIRTLLADGLFAGQIPTSFCRSSEDSPNGHWVVRGDVIVRGNHYVEMDEINHVPLKEIANKIWYKNRDAVVTQGQVFHNVYVAGDLEHSGSIKDIDFQTILKRYVNVADDDREQQITGEHSFQSVIFANVLEVWDLKASEVNDVDIADLEQHGLRKDAEQIVKSRLEFAEIEANDIAVSGLVNGVNITEDLMRKDRENVVTGKKQIDMLQVIGDLKADDNVTIDGVDISGWKSRAVLSQGDVRIEASVIFDDLVLENILRVLGKINGLSIDSGSVLMLHGNQSITGNIEFSTALAEGFDPKAYPTDYAAHFGTLDVYGKLGDVDLQRFFTESVKRSVTNIFSSPVSVSSFSAAGLNDASTNSTVSKLLKNDAISPQAQQLKTFLDSSTGIGSLISEMKDLILAKGSELKNFYETDPGVSFPSNLNALYGLGDAVCFTAGQSLHCSPWTGKSFSESWFLGKFSRITGMAATTAEVVLSIGEGHNSVILRRDPEGKAQIVQELALDGAADVAALVVENYACLAFADGGEKVSLYCSPGEGEKYAATEVLDIADAKQLKFVDLNGTTLLAVLSVKPRTTSRIVLFQYGESFVPWKYVIESQLLSMDVTTLDEELYIGAVASSVAGGHSGDVIVWKIDATGTVQRLQRLSVSDATKIQFATLPNGRLALIVLQCGGVDSILVHVQQGSGLFKQATAVHAAGAFDFHVVSGASPQMALVVAIRNAIPAAHVPSLRVYQPQFVGLLPLAN